MTLQPYVKERMIVFLIILALYISSVALGTYWLPTYEHSSGIRDIGHLYVPQVLLLFGRETSQYIWWLGTLPEELLYAAIVLTILLTGKGIRLGLCLYAIYFLHWLFLHATTLPVPDNMVGLFPEGVFTLAKLDRPDFWFSGHVANAFVIALATTKSPRWLKVLAWVFFAFQILLVLSTRTHYTIDVLGALFVAYTVHHFSFGVVTALKRWAGMTIPQQTGA